MCCKYGVSRPALRRWLKRCAHEGTSGLEGQSHRPKGNLTRKVFENQEK
ncbi:MAG: helix-turn-helix domain-containing protein [Holosporaceae bacterium]|nr:helix-turn-helix domain-containing protein [Holosporaceae bacterium]